MMVDVNTWKVWRTFVVSQQVTWVALRLAGLAGPNSQFSKRRMALLVDQIHSVLPLRSAKTREFGELWRAKCTRAPLTFPFKLVRTSSIRPARTDQWKANLVQT